MCYIFIIFAIVIIDGLIKWWIRNHDIRIKRKDGFIRITHLENGGAAGGYGAKNRNLLVALSGICIVILLGLLTFPFLLKTDSLKEYNFLQTRFPHLYGTSLALILGGGISNLSDRLIRGTVTDYIQFPHVPLKKIAKLVFNLSDFCIFTGAVIYLFIQFRGK